MVIHSNCYIIMITEHNLNCVQLEIDHFRNNNIGEELHYNTTMVAS